MIADAPRRDTIGESSFDEVEPGNGHTLLLARRIRTRSARFRGRGAGGSGNDNSGIVYLSICAASFWVRRRRYDIIS